MKDRPRVNSKWSLRSVFASGAGLNSFRLLVLAAVLLTLAGLLSFITTEMNNPSLTDSSTMGLQIGEQQFPSILGNNDDNSRGRRTMVYPTNLSTVVIIKPEDDSHKSLSKNTNKNQSQHSVNPPPILQKPEMKYDLAKDEPSNSKQTHKPSKPVSRLKRYQINHGNNNNQKSKNMNRKGSVVLFSNKMRSLQMNTVSKNAREVCKKNSLNVLFQSDWTADQLQKVVWDLESAAERLDHDDHHSNNNNNNHDKLKKDEQYRKEEIKVLRSIETDDTWHTHKPVDLSSMDNGCHVLNVDLKSFLSNSHSNANANSNLNSSMRMTKEMLFNNQPNITVIINTWQREKCLMNALTKWSECDSIERIVVVSSDPLTYKRWSKYPWLLTLFNQGSNEIIPGKMIYLHTQVLGSDKLTDRFKYDSNIMTDVLFPVDDDIIYDCKVIKKLRLLYTLLNFNKDEHRLAVTVNPNQREFHFTQVTNETELKDFRYTIWYGKQKKCFSNGAFLTLGGLIHKEYLLAFHSNHNNDNDNGDDDPMYEIRKLVDRYVTAEDVAMSILYSSMHNGLPPYFMIQGKKAYIPSECAKKESARMHVKAKYDHRNEVARLAATSFGFTDTYGGHSLLPSTIYFKVRENLSD